MASSELRALFVVVSVFEVDGLRPAEAPPLGAPCSRMTPPEATVDNCARLLSKQSRAGAFAGFRWPLVTFQAFQVASASTQKEHRKSATRAAFR